MAIENLTTKADLERFIIDVTSAAGALPQIAIKGLQEALLPIAWATPELEPGWEQYGDPEYAKVAYRTEQSNAKVCLRGLVAGGEGAIFQLPKGLAPARQQIFPCLSDTGLVRVDIFANGDVVSSVAAPTFLSLDPICFWAGG